MHPQRKKRTLAIWLVMLLGALAIFAASSGSLLMQRNAEGFSFAEREGDASVLDQICLTGILEDSFQRVAFASQGQAFTHQTLRQRMLSTTQEAGCFAHYYHEPLPGAETEREVHESNAQIDLPEGKSVSSTGSSIHETADQFALYLTDGSFGDFYAYRVPTKVTYYGKITTMYESRNGQKGNFITSNAPWELWEPEAAVQIGEKWYVVTVTDASCRGTGGIYDLTGLAGRNSWSVGETRLYERENLYPVDLKDGEVQLLTMRACGEKLALFVRIDGSLTLRLIDPATWETDQIIALPDWEGMEMRDMDFVPRGRFAVLTMPQTAVSAEEEETPARIRKCDVIDLAEGKVVAQAQGAMPMPAGGSPDSIVEDALYTDGTIYLIFYAGKWVDNSGMEQNNWSGPVAFPCLVAYRDGEQVFSCMIRSGQQEDERTHTPQQRRYTQLRILEEEEQR